MKRLAFFIVLIFVGMTFAVDAMAAPRKVAVFVEGNMSSEQKSMVNSALMARLSGNKEYKVFERNEAFLKALVREQDYQLSGEVPEEQIRNVGERFGVDYVIAICAVLNRDDQCHMSARLINLETGEVVKTCNISREYESSATITAMANNVAYRLLNNKSK